MQEFMVSEQEWLQQEAGKFYLPEEQKEEKDYLHRSQLCDLFFYVVFYMDAFRKCILMYTERNRIGLHEEVRSN